jgi:hypothetical protein
LPNDTVCLMLTVPVIRALDAARLPRAPYWRAAERPALPALAEGVVAAQDERCSARLLL